MSTWQRRFHGVFVGPAGGGSAALPCRHSGFGRQRQRRADKKLIEASGLGPPPAADRMFCSQRRQAAVLSVSAVRRAVPAPCHGLHVAWRTAGFFTTNYYNIRSLLIEPNSQILKDSLKIVACEKRTILTADTTSYPINLLIFSESYKRSHNWDCQDKITS